MSKTYKIIDGVKEGQHTSSRIKFIPEETVIVLDKIQYFDKYNDEIHGYYIGIHFIDGQKHYLYEEESVRDKYFEGLQEAIEHMND